MNSLINKIKQISEKLFIIEKIDNNLVFEPENDNGFIEYKRTLAHCTSNKMQQYASQMKWRISENVKKNFAVYYIGLDDSGKISGLTDNDIITSITNFVEITTIISASIKCIYLIQTNNKTILKICVKSKKNIQDYECDF